MKEVPGDLFQSIDSLAHCVSEDFSMSAGIATQFGKRFPPMQDVCFNMYVYKGNYQLLNLLKHIETYACVIRD